MPALDRSIRRVVHVAIGLLACVDAAAWSQDPPALRPGDTISGEIADGDPVVETETLRDGYTDAPTLGRSFRLEVEEAGSYTIELRSCFFDAYLVVRDAGGKVEAEDDDGLISTHSRVVLDVSAGASLRVEACALHGERGGFELAMQSGSAESMEPVERQTAEIEDARYCLAALEGALGPEHLEVATRLNKLGLLLADSGDFAGARPMYERSLAILEAALGPEHPDVASSLSNQGMLLRHMGEYAAARPLYERALAIREQALGPEHPRVAQSLNNLGLLLHKMGDLAGARPLLERSLAVAETALGPDDPDVATSMDNLASLLGDTGDFAGARRLYERALAIREQALGPDHPDTSTSLNNLGLLLTDMGEFAQARPLLERSVAISEQALGPDHPDVAMSLGNLGLLLFEMGDFAGARPLYERSLAIQEQSLGPEHPTVGTSLNDLAVLLQAMGHLAAARPLFERSLAIREQALGPEHAGLATMLNNLSILLRDTGDTAGAQALAQRALVISEKALGPEHPDVAKSLTILGVLLKDNGDFAGARPLLERSLAIREQALGPEHPDVATSLNSLAWLLKDQGDHAAARPLYERSLAIWEQAVGPEHPEVALILNNLGALLRDQGDYAAARPLYERSLAIWEQTLGPQHPDVAMSLTDLAWLALDQGDALAALAYLRRAESARSAFLAGYLSASNESDALIYTDTIRYQVELSQSPAPRALQPDLAYASLLSWKGQVLRATRASRAALRAAMGEEAGALSDRLASLSSTMSRNTNTLSSAGAMLDAAALQALSDEYQDVQRQLMPLLSALLPPVPTWSELRAALPAGTALVDFFVHDDYVPDRRDGETLVERGHWTEAVVTAWITRPDSDGPVPVDLGPAAAIEAAVRAPLESLSTARGGALTPRADRGAEATRLIWEPLRGHLEGADTVIVSPDGVIATIPFELLRGADGRYLVEERSFVYLTDPTDLVRMGAIGDRAKPSLLCVGDVDFDQAAEDVTPPTSPDTPGSTVLAANLRGSLEGRWQLLPATASEISSVAAEHATAFSTAESFALTGPSATEESLKLSLPKYSALHLATHAYCNPEGLPSLDEAVRDADERERDRRVPSSDSMATVTHRFEGLNPGLLSGLVCAGANRSAELPPGRDDGYLTAEEVGWLDLSGCDLVVLSACDTGLGRPQSGEGMLGLRRAFLTSGARTVISSLWSVPDQETAELMGLFYENLWAKRMGKHAALRAAQLEMIRRNRERFGGDARPATWGAFVVDGDWR